MTPILVFQAAIEILDGSNTAKFNVGDFGRKLKELDESFDNTPKAVVSALSGLNSYGGVTCPELLAGGIVYSTIFNNVSLGTRLTLQRNQEISDTGVTI